MENLKHVFLYCRLYRRPRKRSIARCLVKIPRSRCLFESYIVPNRLTPTATREHRLREIAEPGCEPTECEVLSSSVTSASADFCATIGPSASLRQGRAVCPLVSAVLARGVCAVIPRFFYAAEIAAAKMLLFLRELAAMVF